MTSEARPWPPSTLLLVIAAIMLIGTGGYFIFIRPALLVEDVRYMGLSAAQLDVVQAPLARWLTQVFRVMGGYVLATGVLAMTLALTAFREHRIGAAIGVLTGGIASIGWMTIVNFMIDSDFKWVLFCIAFIWAASLILFLTERLAGNPRAERAGT
jgi:hypothetical protein